MRGKKVREEPFFKEVRFRIIEDPNTAMLALKAGAAMELALALAPLAAEHGPTVAELATPLEVVPDNQSPAFSRP